MRKAGTPQVFRSPTKFHKHGRLVDHLAGAEADDMRAEHAIRRLVGEDLYEAVRMQHGAGATVSGERELSDLVFDAGLFQLLLGLADGGDLGLV